MSLKEELDLLTPHEVAEFLGISVGSLNVWRSQKKRFPYIKIGHYVFYKKKDIMEYIDKCRVLPEK